SAEAVPPGQPSYDAYRYLEAHYPRSVVEPVTVAVDGQASPAQLAAYGKRIEAVGDVVSGTPFVPAPRADVAYANFALSQPALSGTSQDAVHSIRDLPPPGSASVLVS